MIYISEQEEGYAPRQSIDIGEEVWRGIWNLVTTRIEDGSFGASYPAYCYDGPVPTGTDRAKFVLAMQTEIPNLSQEILDPDLRIPPSEIPHTLDILDLIQFCWRNVGKPILGAYHRFFLHHHLEFDKPLGQKEFRDDINRIFRRRGIAYELTEKGDIRRIVSPILKKSLVSPPFNTGDIVFDNILKTAIEKIYDPDPATRRESLMALWDAWERLKTIGGNSDKKTQMTQILHVTSGDSSPKFGTLLEREAKEITRIGNTHLIRHSETAQEPLGLDFHVDYLFHRLYCLIELIVRANFR